MMWTASAHENHQTAWTSDQLELLRQLFSEGKTVPQIATVIERSQEAVRTKGRALDLMPKRARRKSVSSGKKPTFFFS